MRTYGRNRVAFGLVLGWLVLLPALAGAAPSKDLASLINAERSARGLPPLKVVTDLSALARSHSDEMAQTATLYHSDIASELDDWKRFGENVGRGATPREIHKALMESPPHRANILSSTVSEMGVGVVSAGEVLYVTEVFVARTTVTTRTAVKPGTVPEVVAAPRPKPVASAAPPSPEPAAAVESPTLLGLGASVPTSRTRDARLLSILVLSAASLQVGTLSAWVGAWRRRSPTTVGN